MVSEPFRSSGRMTEDRRPPAYSSDTKRKNNERKNQFGNEGPNPQSVSRINQLQGYRRPAYREDMHLVRRLAPGMPFPNHACGIFFE